MNRFSRFSKAVFILIFSLLSVQNMFVGGLVNVAQAAECVPTGVAEKLAIFTTTKSDGTRPTTSLDPQTIIVNQLSTKLEVEINDNCDNPVASLASTKVSISITPNIANLSSDSRGSFTNPFTITTGNKRRAFYLIGSDVGIAAITASTTIDSLTPLSSGTQIINVTAPAPTQYGSYSNIHGIPDSVIGSDGSVAKKDIVPDGIIIRSYYSSSLLIDGVSTKIAETIATDEGGFEVNTGDDQYRNVYLRAVYPGTTEVPSEAVVVEQYYPAIVSNLKVMHGTGDKPSLTWSQTEDEPTFAVYRKLAPDVFSETSLVVKDISTPFFEDTSALPGVKYNYAVKQIVDDSYTPEFLPTVDIRLDLSNVVFLPAGSLTSVTMPTVTFNVTPDLYNQWGLDKSVIKAQYTNTTTNAVYLSIIAASDPALFTMVAAGPYLDAVGTPMPSLPDGSYTSKLMADDSVLVEPNVPLGIMDSVTNVVTYSIDSVLPTAPLLSKLRYSNSILFGIAGAVEPNVFVDVYGSASLISTSKLGSATADATGAFQFPAMPIPTGGIFYLVARDATSNLSPATAFDVVTLPIAPDASKLTMEMNKPGALDRILGGAGAVVALATVRIFGADPALSPGLVPLYEFLANSDGSFTQNVGDNQSGAYWVAVWNGAGNLSTAVKLSNATAIAAPASFMAIGGDNSVTLHWDLVVGASYYTIEVYNISTKQNLSTATVSGTQSSLKLTLVNGSSYRFYIHAVDATGNTSLPMETESTPHAPRVVYAVASVQADVSPPVVPVAEPVTVRSQEVTKAKPKVMTEAVLPAPPVASAPEPETRDWTTALIVGLGVVLLALAWFFGRKLWMIDSSETVVTTIKKPNSKKTTDTKKKSDAEKPRW